MHVIPLITLSLLHIPAYLFQEKPVIFSLNVRCRNAWNGRPWYFFQLSSYFDINVLFMDWKAYNDDLRSQENTQKSIDFTSVHWSPNTWFDCYTFPHTTSFFWKFVWRRLTKMSFLSFLLYSNLYNMLLESYLTALSMDTRISGKKMNLSYLDLISILTT